MVSKMTMKLKTHYDAATNEITVIGNSEGLQFLSQICTRIIGKEGPAAHWHFSQEFNNLLPGSTPMVVCHFEEVELNEHVENASE